MPLPASGTLKASDINVELGRSSTATFSLKDASTGVYGALSSPACGAWTVDGSTPYTFSSWYNYDHSFASCTAADTSEATNSCNAETLYGCGVDGDTYNVFHDGCCGYYCTFVSSGCI